MLRLIAVLRVAIEAVAFAAAALVLFVAAT
jgi:hypothetical protein